MLGANWYQNAVFTPANVAPVATDVEALDEQISQTQLGRLGDMIELTYDRWVEEASSRKSGPRVSLKFCGISGSGRFPPTRSSRPLVFPPPAGRGAASSPWRRPSGSMNRASSFWSVLCAPRCMRPKISSMLGQLWGRGWWEPPIKVLDPVDQLDIVSGANVMSGMDASSVRVDRKDVWTHGEQFVNCGTAEHPYTLPVATGPTWVAASTPEDLRGEYCSLADVDALFSGAAANQKFCFYEGIVRLSVKGVVTDETPDPAVRINRQVRG